MCFSLLIIDRDIVVYTDGSGIEPVLLKIHFFVSDGTDKAIIDF